MSNRAVNHHIVPEVLQKQFAIDGDPERILRSKRDQKQVFNEPEKKRISKSFVIRDYNTVLKEGKRSDEIEKKFYGRIDDFLGRFIPEVVGAFERRELPKLARQTIHDVRNVCMDMAKRTPDFHRGHDDLELGRELIQSCLDVPSALLAEQQRKEYEEQLQDEKLLRDKGRHIRVTGTLKTSKKVRDALKEFSVRWSVSESKHSFILSSMMAYRIGNGGPNGLSNPKMELWMPISPKIAMVLVRDPYNKIPIRVPDTRDHIRKVNEYALENSFEIASHSEALLKSLLKRSSLMS